ncbi:hypothetical protein [Aquimarina algiphila]|uniref:hypothetical protein n=1 Tax=Aquimarina algiphila TaxID=2047982 RepID=UPI00249318F3|nr:hypothetical protein [Aquimarina algiphila]
MIFRKKKIPAIKSHLANNGSNIINSKNQEAKYLIKFLFILLTDKQFGENKKEKRKLDNDVAVFELICFAYSRLIEYINSNHSDKKIIEKYGSLRFENIDENNREIDVLELIEVMIEGLHKHLLNWENVKEKIRNRVNFYYENKGNLQYIHQVLQYVVYISPEQIVPQDNLTENFNILDLSIETSLKFSVNMMSFEKSYFPLIYKEMDQYFIENINSGYSIPYWLKK